ncbi:MAG TPA: acetylglutamate kinase [Puia sp.]|jgi:acetylglutamate kinase|nr:acetylglutamate kinase [Puia sp.]
MESLCVIKIGGNIIDDDALLSVFLKKFAAIKSKKILVHGGGKLATRLAEKLNIPQQLIDGRRITDGETLKIVTMVYAGYINKHIVAELQSLKCNSIGISGADGNSILAHKREKADIDYGFAGDIDRVNAEWFRQLMDSGICIVVSSITHDGNNQLLNTNADTIAQEISKAMSPFFEVDLIYSFEKPGVLLDVENENSVIPKLSPGNYKKLKESGKIFSGMIPKLDNAFKAIDSGVNKVIIGTGEELDLLISGKSGTTISHE